MVVFQSLGELSGYLDDRGSMGVTVVDPPMTLMEAADFSSRHVWKAQPSVRKVVDYIARQVASTQLHYYQRVSQTERLRVTDGRVPEVLRKPSSAPRQTRYRFWHSVLVDRLVYDRWAVLTTENEGRLYFTRLPARRVHFKTDALDQVVEIQVHRKDGGRWDIDPEKCIFDAGYSTTGGNGSSPMDTLKDILNESHEAVAFRRDVLKRGARFPGYISRPTAWPADGKARERFATGWRQFEASGGRTGGTPLLEDGMEYKDLSSFKPTDLELMSGRQLVDAEVAAAYHIAPELVGARQGNFSNVDAFRQMLYGPSLGPYFTEWEQAVDIAMGDEDHYVEANLDAKLRGSFLEQAAVTSSAVGAPWMTRNEARAMRNLPAIDGGDDVVTPLNVLVGGQANPRDTGSQNVGPKRARPGAKSRTVSLKADGGGITDQHAEAARRVLTGFFSRQSSTVLSAIGTDGDDWFDSARWDRELAEDLTKVAHTLATAVGRQAAEELGYEPDVYDADRTVEFLKAVAERWAININLTTEAQLKAQVEADDPDPAHVFEVAEGTRAEEAGHGIARFTAGFAVVEVARHISDEDGTTWEKTWVTGHNPRSSHAAMSGQTVPVGEPFSNGMQHPGDSSNIDEVAGCNCSLDITAT